MLPLIGPCGALHGLAFDPGWGWTSFCECKGSDHPYATLVTCHACVLQEGDVDLSVAFEGASVREATCFLRFIYSPDDVAPSTLAVLTGDGGELAAVAGLAHKLDAGRLLAKIDSFLQGKQSAGAKLQTHCCCCPTACTV